MTLLSYLQMTLLLSYLQNDFIKLSTKKTACNEVKKNQIE